ncbi:MAG: hypothetical protein AAFR04_08865 [Pseudomonadota bacterium]
MSKKHKKERREERYDDYELIRIDTDQSGSTIKTLILAAVLVSIAAVSFSYAM